MLEAALVLDRDFRTIYCHLPPGRTGVYLPDSRDLWSVLWEHREILGGVAHLHPWYGKPYPSEEDRTTFSAIDRAIGRQLMWPIATLNTVHLYSVDQATGLAGRVRSDLWLARMDAGLDLSLLRALGVPR